MKLGVGPARCGRHQVVETSKEQERTNGALDHDPNSTTDIVNAFTRWGLRR